MTNRMKLFAITIVHNKVVSLSLTGLSSESLMFSRNARAYLSVTFNIRLCWKGLQVTNTQAY